MYESLYEVSFEKPCILTKPESFRLTLPLLITTAADESLKYFSFFFVFNEKQGVTFYVNHMLNKQFTWYAKLCFL